MEKTKYSRISQCRNKIKTLERDTPQYLAALEKYFNTQEYNLNWYDMLKRNKVEEHMTQRTLKKADYWLYRAIECADHSLASVTIVLEDENYCMCDLMVRAIKKTEPLKKEPWIYDTKVTVCYDKKNKGLAVQKGREYNQFKRQYDTIKACVAV